MTSESSFNLPTIEDIRTYNNEHHLYQFQEHCRDTVLERFRTAATISDIPLVTDIVTYLALTWIHRQPRRSLIIIRYNTTEDRPYRISRDENTFYDVAMTFIIMNIQTYGIFTELWEQIPYDLFRNIGNQDDDFADEIVIVSEEDIEQMQLDSLYDENRDKIISDLYDEHDDKPQPITIISEQIDINDDIKSCELCYDDAEYVCSKCHYPICDSCKEHLRKSTGKCPCCQNYPLELCKINKVLLDKNNESTERTKQEFSNHLVACEESI